MILADLYIIYMAGWPPSCTSLSFHALETQANEAWMVYMTGMDGYALMHNPIKLQEAPWAYPLDSFNTQEIDI